MQTALEYIIKINTADAKANLANFSNSAKSELAKAARIDVKLDAAGAKQSASEATQAISKGFIDAKARARELYEEQRNVVASLQLMGKSGTKEFASAQSALMKTRQEVEKFDKAIEKADVKGFSEKIKGIGSAAQSVLGPLGLMGAGLSLAGAVSSAVEMEKATARIRTLGGAAKEIAPDLQKLALAMSRDIPISAIEMQTAMYDALSSGISANTEDMKAFTETAGKLAVGGGETIGNTVKLLSSITNAYGQSASQAAENSDILFTAVNLGVITIPELNQSLSQVVPTAAAMGVNLKNVGASLAVMTSNGVPAAQATTRLNALLNELQKPSASLAPILAKLGISIESIASEGVPATLQKITGELQSMGINASAVFSSMEATSAFNTLTVGGEKFQQTLDQFANSAGATESAFGEMENTVSAQFDHLKANLQELAINVGSNLLPPIKSAVETISPAIVFLSQNLSTIAPAVLAVVAATKIWSATIAFQNSAIAQNIIAQIAHNTALGAKATVTGIATVATKAFNAAMRANPLGAVLTAVTLLTGGIIALTSWLHKSKEEQLQSNKEMGEALATQKKDTQATYDNVKQKKQLVDEYKKLGLEGGRSTEQQKRFEELQGIINKNYPELHVNTNKFSDDLGRLEEVSRNTGDKLQELDGKLTRLSASMTANLQRQFYIEADVAKNNFVKELGDAFGFWTTHYNEQAKLMAKVGEIYGKNTPEQVRAVMDQVEDMFADLSKKGIKFSTDEKVQLQKALNFAREFGQKRIDAMSLPDKQEKERAIEQAKQEEQIQNEAFNKIKQQIDARAKLTSETERKTAKDSIQTQLNAAQQNAKITKDQYNQLSDLLKAQDKRQNDNTKNSLENIEKEKLANIKNAQEKERQDLEAMQNADDLDLKYQGFVLTKADEVRKNQELLNLLIKQKEAVDRTVINLETDEAKKEAKELSEKIADDILDQKFKVENLEFEVDEENKKQMQATIDKAISELPAKIKVSIENENYQQATDQYNALTGLLKERIKYLQEENATTKNTAKINENNAKIEESFNQIEDAENQKNYVSELERISRISDENERMYQQALLDAKKKYDDEVGYGDISLSKLLNAKMALNAELLEADKRYAEANKNIYQSAVETVVAGFKNIEIPEIDTESAKNQIKEEEKQLLESYRNRQITIEEYNNKAKEINQRGRTGEKSAQATFEEAFRKSTISAMESLYKQKSDELIESQKKENVLKERQIAIQQALDEYKVLREQALADKKYDIAKDLEEKEKALNDEKTNIAKQQSDLESKITAQKIVMYGAYFTQVLAENKKFGKSSILLAIKMLEAEVPVRVAEAIIKSFADNPILGAIIAGSATAAIYAALALAQSAASKLNFRSGVVDLKGPGTETSDSIAAYLSRGESVATAKATKAEGNAEFLRWTNKTGGSIYDYVSKSDEALKNVIARTERKFSFQKRIEQIYNISSIKLQVNEDKIRAEFRQQTEEIKTAFKDLQKNLDYNFKNRKIAEVYNNNKIEQKIIVQPKEKELWR